MEAACIWNGAANKWGDINNKCYTDHACQILFAGTTFPSAFSHNCTLGPRLLSFYLFLQFYFSRLVAQLQLTHNTVRRWRWWNLILPGCTAVCHHVIDRFPHCRYVNQYLSYFIISFLPLIYSPSGVLCNALARLVQTVEAILDFSHRSASDSTVDNLTWYLKSN